VAPLPLGAGYWPPGGLPLAAVACGRCRTARAPCPVARRPPTASPPGSTSPLPVEQRAAGCLVGMHDVV